MRSWRVTFGQVVEPHAQFSVLLGEPDLLSDRCIDDSARSPVISVA
jgi:hypothetical protein